MITAIDTNVIGALWDRDPALSSAAQAALDSALGQGSLLVSAPVFAELLAAPGRDESLLDRFFRDTGISVDWNFNEAVWRAAGLAFGAYAARRKQHGDSGPWRLLADFVIGAHAMRKAHRLLTLDDRFFRIAFPRLRVVRV